MRYACGMQHVQWYYEQTTGCALLLGQTNSGLLCQQPIEKVLRTGLQLYQDIHIKQHYEQQLRQQATTDPLTQLPNRSLALDRLSQALINRVNQDKLIFALFIDIVHFKDINEALGHQAGDKILTIIGQRIHNTVRTGDTVCLLYTSPSPRDQRGSRMPSSA